MAIERRKTRSDVPQEALRLYLDSMAARSGLSAIAIASDEGLLIAASRGHYDADGLAAITVAKERRIPMRTEAITSVLGAQRLSSHPLRIQGEMLHVAWLGAGSPSLEDMASAIRRILGPSLRSASAAVC